MEYVRANAANSVKEDNRPDAVWFEQKLTNKKWI